MRLAACIQTSEDNEPIDQAVLSVAALGTDIEWLFVESPAGRHRIENDAAVREVLRQKQLNIQDTGNMEESLPKDCEAVLFVPPNCALTKVGYHKLARQTEAHKDQRLTHYSLTTLTTLASWSLFYGWLVVIFAIDQFWTWFDRHRHPLDRHVRLVYVAHVGRHRWLSARHWFWRIWNDGECKAAHGGSAAELQPIPALSGFALAVNQIRRHPYLVRISSPFGNLWAGLWLFFVYGVARIAMSSVSWVISGSVYGMTVLLLYLMVQRQLHAPILFAYCALWPIYAWTLPFFAIVVRLFY